MIVREAPIKNEKDGLGIDRAHKQSTEYQLSIYDFWHGSAFGRTTTKYGTFKKT